MAVHLPGEDREVRPQGGDVQWFGLHSCVHVIPTQNSSRLICKPLGDVSIPDAASTRADRRARPAFTEASTSAPRMRA